MAAESNTPDAPDFDPRTYGASTLPEIIGCLPAFELKQYKGKGSGQILAYRSKNPVKRQRGRTYSTSRRA